MSRVYVFQMGKVGSTSIMNAVDGIQVHHLNWRNLRNSFRGGYYRHQLNSLRMRLARPDKIITAVREPVARNISAFMQNHRDFGFAPTMESFLANFRHEEPLEWFDEEMKPFTGIDAFAHPFPHSQGWQIIADRLLILRAESDDAVKQEAVSTFLGRKIEIGRENVSSAKQYASSYHQMREAAPPREYVDRLLDSRYTQHFYSPEEIAGFRSNWYQRIESHENG